MRDVTLRAGVATGGAAHGTLADLHDIVGVADFLRWAVLEAHGERANPVHRC